MINSCRFMCRGIFIFLAICYFSCSQIEKKQNLEVEKRMMLDLPSASGIQFINDSLYIIGDNTPWLYVADKSLQIQKRHLLQQEVKNTMDTIIKAEKSDFEALAYFNDELFIIGSGSKSPERDSLIVSKVNSSVHERYSLTELYDLLKKDTDINDDELNIEGAAIHEGTLFLFNRGKNLMVSYDLSHFKNSITDPSKHHKPGISSFQLPEINEIEAGFSGATIIPNEDKILFSASVEDTENWIDDGEVLGSFIGIIDLQSNEITTVDSLKENGEFLRVKIESLAVKEMADGKIHLVLVSDNDDGTSEIFEVNYSPD